MKCNVLRPMALFGTVAVMLAVTVVLTFSRATVSSSGLGNVKCYDVTAKERAC
jgi:hypothetical protein